MKPMSDKLTSAWCLNVSDTIATRIKPRSRYELDWHARYEFWLNCVQLESPNMDDVWQKYCALSIMMKLEQPRAAARRNDSGAIEDCLPGISRTGKYRCEQ